jgi:hypothetical protein
MVTVAICPACGYPTVGPDLCFYCRPAAIVPRRDVAEVSPQPALRRRDGEQAPLAWHALEFVSAALLEPES